MTLAEQRAIALGAIRSHCRHNGIDPTALDAKNAYYMLDELARINPDLVASRFYQNASDNQYRLFCKEWNAWRRVEQERAKVFAFYGRTYRSR